MIVVLVVRSRSSRWVRSGLDVGPGWMAMKMMWLVDRSMSSEDRLAPICWNDCCRGVRMSLIQIWVSGRLSRFPISYPRVPNPMMPATVWVDCEWLATSCHSWIALSAAHSVKIEDAFAMVKASSVVCGSPEPQSISWR